MDSTVNRARTGGNQFFLKMEGNINQLIIDETFNPGQIKSKKRQPRCPQGSPAGAKNPCTNGPTRREKRTKEKTKEREQESRIKNREEDERKKRRSRSKIGEREREVKERGGKMDEDLRPGPETLRGK